MSPSNRLLSLFLVLAWLLGGRFGARGFDPVTEDPPGRDEAFPADLVEELPGLESSGDRLNGILYRAAGAGPHPTVLLLHGLPGSERHGDLAHVLRRAGFHVAFIHYRGSWGSEGEFGVANCVEDAGAMLDYLRSPEVCEEHRIDPERLYLVGHSLGGGVALVAAASDPKVRGVAALAPADLGPLLELPEEVLSGYAGWVEDALPLTVEEGHRAFAAPADADLHLATHAGDLADRPVLIVTGSRDRVIDREVQLGPLLEGLEESGSESVTLVELDADHAFSSRRIALARALLAWLEDA